MTDLDVHLSAIAAGDADAFGRWLSGAEPSLRGRLRSFAGRVDTEAVLQEALLRVWQVAPRFQPDGRPNALLRFADRVARNLAIDHARRERGQPLEPEVLERFRSEEAGPAEAPDPLLREAIVDCVDKLPGKPASALKARMRSVGLSHDRDIAATVEMTLNTFLKNIGRARRLLVDCLSGHGVVVEVP